jgi:amino-acid N-acetyltransferase
MQSPQIVRSPPLETVVALLTNARLPASDITLEQLEHFHYAGAKDAPTGIVGLEIYGPVALLRSLAVVENARSTGLGRALAEHAERYAQAHGVTQLYLLTTTAESFFANRGYLRIDRDKAPKSIQATREFSGICPASSTFMVKRL